MEYLEVWKLIDEELKGSGTSLDEIVGLGSAEHLCKKIESLLAEAKRERVPEYDKIMIDRDCPEYEGYSEVLAIDGKYFQSWDAEGYSSGINEISEKEYRRLEKYEYIKDNA
jgi:hypothetical protein